MKLTHFFKLSFLLVLLFAYSCGGDSKDQDKENDKDSELVDKKNEFDNVMIAVPPPMQISEIIKNSGAGYLNGLVNNPSNSKKYITNFSKASNLGIYSADLGYLTLYGKTQEAVSYFKVCKNLGDDIGITGGFEESTIKRFENNLGNKDSLINIITESQRNSDEYLKDNERKETSAVVMAGGWIEGIYFATSILKKGKYDNIRKSVAEQGLGLENVLELLGKHKKEAGVGALINDLKSLKDIYDTIEVVKEEGENIQDNEKKMTIIGGNKEYKMTDDQLQKITNKVGSIRSKLVQ